MKVKIIKGQMPDDQQVMVDGVMVNDVDFSGVDSDFWALHWDTETQKGEIEWATYETPNQYVTSESEINSVLGVPLQTMLDRFQASLDTAQAKAEAEAAAEAEASPSLPDWMQNRLNEYPEPHELLVALYDTEDKPAIDAKRAAVKAKWPKDDSGPIE